MAGELTWGLIAGEGIWGERAGEGADLWGDIVELGLGTPGIKLNIDESVVDNLDNF